MLRGQPLHRSVKLEPANGFQTVPVAVVTHGEQLCHHPEAVAGEQGKAAQQKACGRQFRAGTHHLELLIETRRFPVLQVKHADFALRIEHVQPAGFRAQQDLRNPAADLREGEFAFRQFHFAGQEALFLVVGTPEQLMVVCHGDHHEAAVVVPDSNLIDGPSGFIQPHGCLTVGEGDLRRDQTGGAFRIGHLVFVLHEQVAAVTEAECEQVLVHARFAHGGDAHAFRQGQGHLVHDRTGGRPVEDHPARIPEAHGNLALLFHPAIERVAGAGRRQAVFCPGGQLCRAEQWQHFVEQVEENERDGDNHGNATRPDGQAGKTIRQRTTLAPALQGRRIKIDGRWFE